VFRGSLGADKFIGPGARSAFEPVVSGHLTGGAKPFVVIGGHAQRRAQLFIEAPQVPQVRSQGGELPAVIGEQEFLVARIPQPYKLAVDQERRRNGHLVVAVRRATQLGAAAVLFDAHHAPRTSDCEARSRQAFEQRCAEAFLDVPHGGTG